MVVQHNLQAMNSNRMLGITQGTLSGSTEKLSSGYKINRAADDAAGLSISEKMRKQIRGLDQASANAEDGISSVQTAEGALQEVTDMLQRMNELAVQAANGTNSTTDRQYIQDEIDQLVTEVDRVSETTKFNETYLLKGDSSKATTKTYTANYATTYAQTTPGGDKYKVNYTGTNKAYFVTTASIATATGSNAVTVDEISNGDDVTKYLEDVERGDIEKNGVVSKDVKDTYVKLQNTTVDAGDLKIKDGSLVADTGKGDAYILDTKTNSVVKIAEGEDLSKYFDYEATGTTVDKATMKDQYRLLKEVGGGTVAGTRLGEDPTDDDDYTATVENKKLYDADGKEVSGIALNKYFDENGQYQKGLFADSQATSEITSDKISDYVTKTTAEVTADLSFNLHVGADSARTNKISTNIQSMSAAALGIDKLKSSSVGIVDETGDNATDAIDVIADALQKVSTQRSALGAVQNRLEHTIKNLDNIVENTTSAESAIRDTDMATEMVKYSNANILSQAGQSMLAQANQSNQGVLSILG